MKESDKPVPDGVWRCQHYVYEKYWVIYRVNGDTATVIKSSEASDYHTGTSIPNTNWGNVILTRWSTKHYYKLL